jgi:hypothetical protein
LLACRAESEAHCPSQDAPHFTSKGKVLLLRLLAIKWTASDAAIHWQASINSAENAQAVTSSPRISDGLWQET